MVENAANQKLTRSAESPASPTRSAARPADAADDNFNLSNYLYMIKQIKEFVLFSIIFTAIDALYLLSSSKYFNSQIKTIQGTDLKLKPISTILCYITLTIGIFYFGIIKNLSINEIFFLGIFVYGVYEFTNHAILKKWKWKTVFMDTIWGGILFASSVYIFKKIVN